jgi:ubiquinol oxidase
MTELIEEHAYQTYDTYLTTYGAELKTQSAPQAAISYYQGSDSTCLMNFKPASIMN